MCLKNYKTICGKFIKVWLILTISILNLGWLFSSQASSNTDDKSESKLPFSPNFVLIVIDDLGYGDLGIYGNSIHETPNIDRLAREGMLLTDFHSNGAVCSTTRATLMTGQYQQRSGVEYAIDFTKDVGMPLSKSTIAELLDKADYDNGVFGKWHLGHVSCFGPNDQGFGQSVVSNNTPDYHTHVSRTGKIDWFKNHEKTKESGYLTDLVTNHSVEFIREHKAQPFFLFMSHLALHFPFQGPNDPAHRTPGKIWHDTKYGPLTESQYRRAYNNMLVAVDRSVGKIVATLNDMGLREETLIIITSDNGAYHWVGSNFPYRGQKGDLFEGGHRIPAIANWPGYIKAASISDALTMTMDLAPTFLSIAGISSDQDINFDGKDLSPVLFDNKKFDQRQMFWRLNNTYDSTKAHAVRNGGWKYVVDEGKRYLFNLNQDITESNNLVNIYPAIADSLERNYKQWLRDVKK
jgi:arylsulfatase A-like enzyme